MSLTGTQGPTLWWWTPSLVGSHAGTAAQLPTPQPRGQLLLHKGGCLFQMLGLRLALVMSISVNQACHCCIQATRRALGWADLENKGLSGLTHVVLLGTGARESNLFLSPPDCSVGKTA